MRLSLHCPRFHRLLGAVCALLACLCQASPAANWSGILSPERAADWSKAGIPEEIPSRTTNWKTLSPGATAEEINSAIASCPIGQVVLLSAGTYPLSSSIDFANHGDVTLRGAGADQTFLIFTQGDDRKGKGSDATDADIRIKNFDSSLPKYKDHSASAPNNSAEWTDGYAQGATEITLSSTANLVPGKSIICLDQLDDSDAAS